MRSDRRNEWSLNNHLLISPYNIYAFHNYCSYHAIAVQFIQLIMDFLCTRRIQSMRLKCHLGKVHGGIHGYMIAASLDLCRSERKKERTGPDRIQRMDGQERTTFGARHNTVSLLCQTGLGRRMGDIGWGNEVFCARRSMLLRERVYRDRSPRDPRAIRAAFTGRSRSPTDDDKFVDNIDSDTADKIRLARLVPRPAGINSFNERVRVAR